MGLIAFYSGTGADVEGRKLEDIWRYSLDELEDNHDYIQWLFPLRERSAFNPHAPIVDDATIASFRSDDTLRRNLERSLEVMLDFYGLRIGGERIVRSATFGERSTNWLIPGNHNFLRLTRILKSLSLLGLSRRAEQLFACLDEIYTVSPRAIGERTMSFWRRAIERE